MPDYTNRTFICSVLFLDLVEYSARSVTEQIRLKERFNAVLMQAITGVASDDRIILDTGDGAAVSFLGDPEDALFAGMSLRDAVAGGQELTGGGARLQIRIGLNLGPVRLVKDINGQPNIIGDGINVAQRVMSFAEPGQILVSRSYYDVMVRLSEDYSKLFHYEGAKTDKHVREHEVYAIGAAPSSLRRTLPPPAPKPAMRLPSFRIPKLPKLNLRRWAAVLQVNSKLLVAAPLAFLLVVGTGVIARSYRNSDGEVRPAAPKQAPAPAPKAEPPPVKVAAAEPTPPPKAQGPGVAEKANETQAPPKAKRPARTSQAKTAVQAARESKAAAKAKEGAAAPKARDPETVVATAPASSRDAMIHIVALPWAEVYVDGARQGVSPPLRSIPIKPGKHRVELRNSSFPSHIETVDVRSGAEINIRHRFRR
jgi:class 3 adenylate cyclase